MQFERWTKTELQSELRLRQLPVTGTKEVLVARLREGDESETQRSPGRKETSPTKRAPSPVRMTRKPSTVSHYLGQGSRWFREPVTIIKYFGLYLGDLGRNALRWGRERSSWIAILCLLAGIMYLLLLKEGQHQVLLKTLHLQMIWYAWWGLLGIASSIGLGTGLHTFMLFLGPFISQSTMTAYKCGSLDFATRGANSFICPETSNAVTMATISLWSIANKIKWECLCWGIGTAIGELPPYFVARAAASAGKDNDEFVSIERILAKDASERTWSEKFQASIHDLLRTAGFFGILLCASIPNPLFDLAGIICGHFGIPFFTFFGATLIGKAFIKTSIQSLAVVAIFSKDVLETLLIRLFAVAPALHDILQKILNDSMDSFNQTPSIAKNPGSILPTIWNAFLIAMVLYFILSIIESLSLAHMRKHQPKRALSTKKKL